MNETFEKVYIRSEADLPKEEGYYITEWEKTQRFTKGRDEKWWLDNIDWYLRPVTPAPMVSKERIIEVLKKHFYREKGDLPIILITATEIAELTAVEPGEKSYHICNSCSRSNNCPDIDSERIVCSKSESHPEVGKGERFTASIDDIMEFLGDYDFGSANKYELAVMVQTFIAQWVIPYPSPDKPEKERELLIRFAEWYYCEQGGIDEFTTKYIDEFLNSKK